MWSGLSSIATATVSGTSGGDSHDRAPSPGDAGHDAGSHHHHGRRRGRTKAHKDQQQQQHQQLVSNRSSPEASPERPRRLRPLTSAQAVANGSSLGGAGRSRSPNQQQHGVPAAAPAASVMAPETPGTDKMAYFGSNESERDAGYNDEYGDDSSSEDSAADFVESAPLEVDSSRGPYSPKARQYSESTTTSSGRRELLVQRRAPEQPQGFGAATWEHWEQALLRPRRSPVPRSNSGPHPTSIGTGNDSAHAAGETGSPRRPRSLTPNVANSAGAAGTGSSGANKADGSFLGSLASRRRGSPSPGAAGLSQDIASLAAASPANALAAARHRTPTPSSQPTSPLSPGSLHHQQSRGQSRNQQQARGLRRWLPPFRTDLLAEVSIMTFPLILAAYRMASLPTPLNAKLELLTPIPLSPLVMLIIAIPGTALFRRKHPQSQSNYMFPFTDERGYRTPKLVDDGFAAGATIPILLAAGFLWDAVSRGEGGSGYLGSVRPLMDVWRAAGKSPPQTTAVHDFGAVYRTVVVARISLLLSTSINSFVLILNIVLSRTLLSVEKLPFQNTKRLLGSVIVSGTISLFLWTLLALNDAFAWASPYISPAEAAISSFIYQMSIYSVSRLVRRGFTLGELSLATGAGISLALEFWRITLTRLRYAKTGDIPATFRMPTPLVPYQHVLIPGAFLTGFLISPLLVLSRNFAQMPSHRLRRPGERGRNRKLVALGIGLGLVFVVFVIFGGWVGWALGGNLWTAWAWPARFSLLGGDGVDSVSGENSGWRRWRRLGLALYWLAIVTAAVGGWQTRLVRSRRIRLAKSRNAASGKLVENGNAPASATAGSSGVGSTPASGGAAGLNVVKNAHLGVAGISQLREDRRMHVALDLRRKFFHALAVVMFVPAIAIDPAFTSLAFSAAFAIFTFAEYARYFAVVPVGAPIHIFFNEFIDSKDAGPVILSHFYLLTGCAGGLWLEGRGIKNYTGVLSVGIGDAFASVLGRRLGTTRWPNSSKTILGTGAFIVSIFGAAMLLRVTGVVEPFSATRFLLATSLAGLLEAVSAQNDNLVIPIFFWSVLSLLEV